MRFVCLCLVLSAFFLYGEDEPPLEHLVGQLMITYFEGESVNEEIKQFVKDLDIGGVIYYPWANGLTSPRQVRKLSSDLQSLAKTFDRLPLLIAIDQEGGRIQRLREGFGQYPSHGELGHYDDPEYVFRVGYSIGRELAAVGIHLNFAPVVDLCDNPSCDVLSDRTFGADPEHVVKLAWEYMLGLKCAGILSCLKHFPGIGAVEQDPHDTLPIIAKGILELTNYELIPFISLQNFAPFIMSAHVKYPALDSNHVATLSEYILKEILRNNLGFRGIVVTDSLLMEGVLREAGSVEEAAIRALQAGNDLLLFGGRKLNDQVSGKEHLNEIKSVHTAVVKAVRDGRVSYEQVLGSYRRIKVVKEHLLINPLIY